MDIIITYFPESTELKIQNNKFSIYCKNQLLFSLQIDDQYIDIHNFKTNVSKIFFNNILIHISNSKFAIDMGEPDMKKNYCIIFVKKDYIILDRLSQHILYYYCYRNSIKYKYNFKYDADLKFIIYYYFYNNYQYKKRYGKFKNKYTKSFILIPNKYEFTFASNYFNLLICH